MSLASAPAAVCRRTDFGARHRRRSDKRRHRRVPECRSDRRSLRDRQLRRSVHRRAGMNQAVFKQIAEIIRTEAERSEEHTSELQSLMRSSYAIFCLKQKTIE